MSFNILTTAELKRSQRIACPSHFFKSAAFFKITGMFIGGRQGGRRVILSQAIMMVKTYSQFITEEWP